MKYRIIKFVGVTVGIRALIWIQDLKIKFDNC
jgi:hypothetical protein